MHNKKIYIETYGCSANQNNSEIMAGLLASSGYQLTNNEENADILILNTCVVKKKTENKIKRRIQDLSKNQGNSDKLTIVTGCMPDSDAPAINKLNPKAKLLSSHNIKSVVKLVNDSSIGLSIVNNNHNYLINNSHSDSFNDINNNSKLSIINNNYLEKNNEEKILLPKISFNKLISITQISEGCLSKCSFCKTKLAKGNLFSYPQEKIISSIENDLKNGAKEVWLTSQGNENYGIDRGKNELSELLKKILNLDYKFKLRIGMMNPRHLYDILNELIEIYKNPKVYKFLHIPIQSASNKILKDMRRMYNIEKVEAIINKFKLAIPDITIATDIITGYPTENEDDHLKNIEFLKKYKPSVLNLSKFSKHKNTEADKFKELPIKIINERNKEIMNLHRKLAFENKKVFLNKTTEVFVNKKLNDNLYEARDDNYNIVLINPNNNFLINSYDENKIDENEILGKNLIVKIKQIGVHHMIGEMVN